MYEDQRALCLFAAQEIERAIKALREAQTECERIYRELEGAAAKEQDKR